MKFFTRSWHPEWRDSCLAQRGMARILVIDDAADTRAMLARVLASAEHEVVLAGDGQEGMKQHRTAPADLVITDLYMPNQNGFQTIIELRRHFPETVIIAISGGALATTVLSIALKLGAVEVLPKPFASEQLLAAVANALGRASRPV
jgi:DNA-binding response OmpR family regulator